MTMRALADAIEYSPPPSSTRIFRRQGTASSASSVVTGSSASSRRWPSRPRRVDPVERLRRIGLRYADFRNRVHPSHFRFMFLTSHPVPDDDEVGKDDPERNAYAFKQTVKAGLRRGRVPARVHRRRRGSRRPAGQERAAWVCRAAEHQKRGMDRLAMRGRARTGHQSRTRSAS